MMRNINAILNLLKSQPEEPALSMDDSLYHLSPEELDAHIEGLSTPMPPKQDELSGIMADLPPPILEAEQPPTPKPLQSKQVQAPQPQVELPDSVARLLSPTKPKELNIDETKAAIEQKNKNNTYGGFVDAANMIGDALSGKEVQKSYAAGDILRKAGQSGLEDIDTRNKALETETTKEKNRLTLATEEKKRDPNSTISKAYRDFAKSLGKTVPADASAEDLKELTPMFEKIFDINSKKEHRKLEREKLDITKKGMADSKQEKQNNDFIEHTRNQFNKDKSHEAYNTLRSIDDVLEDYIRDPNPVKSMSLGTYFGKLIDPDSTVREGEAKMLGLSGSVANRIYNSVNLMSTGKLPPERAKEFKALVSTRLQSAENEVKRKLNPIVADFKKRGLEDQIGRAVDQTTFDYLTKPKEFSAAQESGISAFMKAHPELSREKAIQILKDNKRL